MAIKVLPNHLSPDQVLRVAIAIADAVGAPIGVVLNQPSGLLHR